MGNKQSAERKDSKDEEKSHSAEGKDSDLLKDEEQNNTITLLLLGRTGTGKSATGNNILQLEDAFISDDSAASVTTECQAEYSHYQGEDIMVVDMPGLCDASKNREEDMQHIVAKAVDAVAEAPDGYDAALIITTYGRQSLDNSTTVEELRDIFGEDVFKEYGILVVTYGDNFKRRKDKNLTFEDYCSKQTGPIKVLYDECHKRAVLFDNVTENPEEMEAQRRKLFDLVKGMSKTKRYTPELFGAAKAKRDELIKEAKHFVLTESMRKDLRLTMNALNKTDIYSEESREKLMEMKDKTAVLIENISCQQQRVQGGKNILKFATSLGAAVEKKQDLVRVISENRAKTRIRERKFRQMISESEKENYKKIWERDDISDKKKIEEMEKLMTDTMSQLEAEYQALKMVNILKQEIIRYLVLGVVLTIAPAAIGAASLGAAGFAVALGSNAFIELASRKLVHDANINLLLLGRTGTGKSTTGNNILQSKSFNTGDSDTLVTTKCQFAYSQYNGTNIKVVDMPGLGDNSKNEDENLKLVIEAAKEAFEVTPDGYDAVLVVTEYGRQSREHRAAVDQLKVIFGQDIFNQYGILAVTYGDNFKRRKDSTQTFEQTCSQQKGQLNDFWKECNKRAVLFDNVTPEEMEAQRMTLFDLVKRMRITRRYTREMFEATEAKRDKLIKQAEQFVLTEAIRKELRVIMHDLKGTDVNNFEESTEKLMKIRERVAALIENISRLPESVRGLKNIMKFSQSLETAIEMKQKLVRVVRGMTAEENIEDIKKKMADKESQLEEEYRDIFRENAQKGDLGIGSSLIFLCAVAGILGYNAGAILGCVVFLGGTAVDLIIFVAGARDFVSVLERLERWFRSFYS